MVHAGLQKIEVVKGKTERTPVHIDTDAKDAGGSDFATLLIPGDCSPDNLRVFEKPVRFVQEFMLMSPGKSVSAICHGPQLLVSVKI